MSQHYSQSDREDESTALPNIEVFYVGTREDGYEDFEVNGEPLEPGFYYWYCLPGCLPDGDPIGPFESEAEAVEAFREDEEW